MSEVGSHREADDTATGSRHRRRVTIDEHLDVLGPSQHGSHILEARQQWLAIIRPQHQMMSELLLDERDRRRRRAEQRHAACVRRGLELRMDLVEMGDRRLLPR